MRITTPTLINKSMPTVEKWLVMLTEAIAETNRVIEKWQSSGAKIEYDPVNSLFCTYLAKIVKRQHNWHIWHNVNRYGRPKIVIHDITKKVVSISLMGYAIDEVKTLDEAIRQLDFQNIITIPPTYVQNVNFNTIQNIKF